jgi:hypothetical protein
MNAKKIAETLRKISFWLDLIAFAADFFTALANRLDKDGKKRTWDNSEKENQQ